MAGQLMLSLSILIVLHEMGHFFPARWFGTRVEKFYLFFDPWFSLIKYKRGDTEYGIGWLPLGGYVKISGMIDESFDKEQMQGEPQPWEFRSKPAWQRLIIMLGGVTVNFILGFLLYGLVLFVWGEEYLPSANVTDGIYVDSLGMEMGLQDGDKILAIDDKVFTRFNDRTLVREIIINNASALTINRDGREQVLPIDKRFTQLLSSRDNQDKAIFGPRFAFHVEEVGKNTPAKDAVLEVGVQIISIDGESTPFYHEFALATNEKRGKTIAVGLIRNGTDSLSLDLVTTEEGKIGVIARSPFALLGTERINYSLSEAIPAGFTEGWSLLNDQFKAFGQMFRGKIKAKDSLGGFGSIASMYGNQWIWERFWRMTAILSLILAFMNLLPIPALDGGHVMFLLYEMATGRKPSDKFMEYATMIGFILVLGLVLYANGLDFLRAFF